MDPKIKPIVKTALDAAMLSDWKTCISTLDLLSAYLDLPQPDAAPAPQLEPDCPHRDEPRGCYRVRCQLGRKCVEPSLVETPAPSAQPEIPDGYTLVPNEPPRDMMEAGEALPPVAPEDMRLRRLGWSLMACQNRRRYLSMLAAAPKVECVSVLQRKPLTEAQFGEEWHRRTGRIMGTDKGLLMQAKYVTEAAHGITAAPEGQG